MSREKRKPAVTGEAHLRVKAPCAAREVDEADVLITLRRQGEVGMEDLLRRNDAVMLDVGVEVIRTFRDDAFSNVRVNSGYYVGRYCWLPTMALQ